METRVAENYKLIAPYFAENCMGINCDNVQIADISEDDIIEYIDDDIDIQFENVIEEI